MKAQPSSFEDFMEARSGGIDELRVLSRRTPGKLARMVIEKMREYLSVRQGGDDDGGGLVPIVKAYLTSVLSPAAGEKIGRRNMQELINLAEALEALIEGNVARTLDILATRFLSVETAGMQGD